MIAAARSFFDKAAVINATTAAERKVLSKFGAYTRTRARNSLRYRRKPAPPGQPPSVHRTQRRSNGRSVSPLRELIYFSFEKKNGRANVVIGPVPFKGPVGIIPPLLEYGGHAPAQTNRRRRQRVLGGVGEIRIGGKHTSSTKRNPDGQYVTYARMRTNDQVDRANRLNEELYGPARYQGRAMAARPFMVPAFKSEQAKLPALWSGAIK